MKKVPVFSSFFVFLFCAIHPQFFSVCAQPRITVFDTSNSPLPSNNVQFVVQDDHGVYWFACGDDHNFSSGIRTHGGLARFDGRSWQVFQPHNSGLPSSDVRHVVIDGLGRIWVATFGGGIACFDGENWTVYTPSNSPLPESNVWTLSVEADTILWIGTRGRGVLRFDGHSWQWWHRGNSPLGSDAINFIIIDTLGIKWIGTDYWGLQSFDGTQWQDHGEGVLTPGLNIRVKAMAIDSVQNRWIGGMHTSVSSAIVRYRDSTWTPIQTLSQDFAYIPAYKGIAIDRQGKAWVATRAGLIHIYSDTLWKRYDLSTYTALPIERYGFLTIDDRNNKITEIFAIDDSTNLWIPLGVAFFNEDSVAITAIVNDTGSLLSRSVRLHPPFPNPFNPQTEIQFELPQTMAVRLEVYNILGQRVARLLRGRLSAGPHRSTFHAQNLPGGIYWIVLHTPVGRYTQKALLVK